MCVCGGHTVSLISVCCVLQDSCIANFYILLPLPPISYMSAGITGMSNILVFAHGFQGSSSCCKTCMASTFNF